MEQRYETLMPQKEISEQHCLDLLIGIFVVYYVFSSLRKREACLANQMARLWSHDQKLTNQEARISRILADHFQHT